MTLTRIGLHPGRPQFAITTVILIASSIIRVPISSEAQMAIAIGQNFTASTLNVDSSGVPPDSNGATGPLHFVEFINGRFSIFRKTDGSKVRTMTDLQFWSNAGLTIPAGWDVTDPRIIYDAASQRWFASQIDFEISGFVNTNDFLLAVSSSADPTGDWKAVKIASDPGGNDFADFPTLGLDSQGVYLGGNMFDPNSNPVGTTLVSVPKSGLLQSAPSAAALTWFGLLEYSARGEVLQPVICLDGSGQGNVIATASVGLDQNGNFLTNTSLVHFQVRNASGPGKATLTGATFLEVLPYTVPLDPFQPDGSSNLDDGDARFSAKVYEVAGVIYAVHSTQIGDRAVLRWYRIDAANKIVLESGTISDPVMDFIYPSIAANPDGTVVVAYNGSSSNTFVSSFASVGRIINGTTTFTSPLLLKSGTASYQNTDSTGTSRWGDYSAISVDPADPSRFWTIQEIPTARSVWSTQVTELLTGLPDLGFAVSATGLQLSWHGTLFDLQTTPDLGSPNWVSVTQNLATNNGVVTAQVPLNAGSGFFRLHYP